MKLDSHGGPYAKKANKQIDAAKKAQTIATCLLDTDMLREDKIQLLNTVMTILYPPLEGDRVTFIGSTFLKYGQKINPRMQY